MMLLLLFGRAASFEVPQPRPFREGTLCLHPTSVLPTADAAEPTSASRTAEPVPVLLLDQLAFLLLCLLGFSEQL